MKQLTNIEYWKYTNKNSTVIIERVNDNKLEYLIYNSNDALSSEYSEWVSDTIEEERQLFTDTITKITHDEVVEYLFIDSI